MECSWHRPGVRWFLLIRSGFGVVVWLVSEETTNQFREIFHDVILMLVTVKSDGDKLLLPLRASL